MGLTTHGPSRAHRHRDLRRRSRSASGPLAAVLFGLMVALAHPRGSRPGLTKPSPGTWISDMTAASRSWSLGRPGAAEGTQQAEWHWGADCEAMTQCVLGEDVR
jgi:hypothetical protein